MQSCGYSKINSTTISFGVAPRINACGRMGHQEEALNLLLSKEENEVKELTQKINEYNYYIAEMCERLNLKFLFSANAMKDEKGGCKEGYCTKDLHPSKDGNDALYEYAKKHLGSIN